MVETRVYLYHLVYTQNETYLFVIISSYHY